MSTLPHAYLLTFHTYGTRLHGDARGSHHHRLPNHPGTRALPTSAGWKRDELEAMNEEPVVLSDAARIIVDGTIREVCKHRSWTLVARNVRSNHVHLVVAARCAPEPVMNSLKAWCTRRLREAALVSQDARVWSRHGSTRYLWTRQAVEAAAAYVVERQ
jgi:REP element-mobilizing transposase RayT